VLGGVRIHPGSLRKVGSVLLAAVEHHDQG
jgi:hypothetical protein